MEVERSVSPGGSSATSTASCSRNVHIYNKAPKQPDRADAQTWSNFLAAYQKGDWARTGESAQSCTKMARKVQVEGGAVIDNFDFFARFKYLAAPPVPREKCKARRDALLRHGFTGPQIRPSVNRYVRHAKSVFKCDFVSVSVASSDDRSTLILGSEGSTCAHLIATNTTMCGHAMLLDEDEVFVVSDLSEDWRFKHLMSGHGASNSMRFYASAPILLTTQFEDEEADTPVHVGRLTIMRKEPWKEFGQEEAEILLDIARMTQEALENEYLQMYSKKVRAMQQGTASLSYKLNQMADSEVFSQESARENEKGFLFTQPSMQLPVDLLREMVGATNVTSIDATALHLSATRSTTTSSAAVNGSPRSSVNYGASSPSAPWMARSSSSSGPFSPSQQSDLGSPSLSSSALPLSEDGSETFFYSGSPSEENVPQHKRRPSRMQHSSTSSSLSDSEMFDNNSISSLRIIASAGDPSQVADVSGPEQCQGVCQFFTALKRKGLFTKPQTYTFSHESDSESEEDLEEVREGAHHVRNTLTSLVSPKTRLCVAIPVFSNDRSQPLFLTLVTWDYNKALVQAERYFCYSIGVIFGAAVFRSQAGMADRAQLDFIRSVQHELRTPLNAVLGITDLLRQSFAQDSEEVKLDMSQDGILANLLESIRLSGVTLSTILDDVLDFGAVTGISTGRSKATTRIEEVDLEREVDDICLDELEHISLHERQDQTMRLSHRGYSAVPSLLVKVSPDISSRFRTDRAKLRKILSKFISNALRFSDEHNLVEVIVQPSASPRREGPFGSVQPNSSDRWLDFIIRDTGMGMTREFLSNSFLKPFSKADSFSQGVGLGVTIAASLISQLGGRFNVQSDLGKGTRVQISLPFGVAAPLRNSRGARRPSQFVPTKPLQVQTAGFYGFETQGQKAVQELIRERLEQNDVRIVAASEKPELLVLQEGVLFASDSPEPFSPAVETPLSMLPQPFGPKARTLVVTRTAMRTRSSSVLDGQTVWYFRPPFGRGSLDLMDEFLREEQPVVLRRVPSPTRVAKENLHKIREERKASSGAVSGAAAPVGVDVRAPQSNADEAESVTTSGLTTTTAATTAPPPSSPTSTDVPISSTDEVHASNDGKTIVRTKSNVVQKSVSRQNGSAENGDGVAHKEDDPFRILVVEDNPVNMRLITVLLQREKYIFEEAKDGMEAVEKYKSFKPSIVLLDISLPLLDGFGACLQMRAHELRHVPKIIAITALSSAEDKVRGLEECGMDDWRTKPLSIKTLRTDLVAWKRDWEDAWGVVESESTAINVVSGQAVAA